MDEPKEVKRVYGIFQDFFGDENVDLQASALDKYNILVHWKEVKVENEDGASTIVYDLYAKMSITKEGYIPMESEGFTLNRSTYTIEQFLADYTHSHVNGIHTSNPSNFYIPCLGRGPLTHTILTLKTDNDSAIWMLFCEELDDYVHVESLRGIPYRYLKNIINNNKNFSSYALNYNCRNGSALNIGEKPINNFKMALNEGIDVVSTFKDFISYFINTKKPRYSYINGRFIMTYDFYDYIINISQCLIQYINNNAGRFVELNSPAVTRVLLQEVKIENRKLYPLVENNHRHEANEISGFEGKEVCTFKGETILTKVIPTPNKGLIQLEDNRRFIINTELAIYIKESIERLINYRYYNGKDNSKKQLWQYCKNVRYI